jgi:prepilin-type N-terminal cleavage/methylation domain-containing protein
MGRRSRQRAALTLVEMLIVITLVGILSALVLPSAMPSIHDELVAGAQIVAADLAYGRSLAVLNNDSYQYLFDVTHNQYTLQYAGTNPTLAALPPSPFQSPQDPATQYIVRLSQWPRLSVPVTIYDVQQLAPQPIEATSVTFGPLGGTTQAQPIVIWLAAGVGAARRFISVSLNPTTGLATTGSFQATTPAASQPSGGSGGSAPTGS